MPPKRKVLFWNDECANAVQNRNRAKNQMHASNNIDDCISHQKLKGISQHNKGNQRAIIAEVLQHGG